MTGVLRNRDFSWLCETLADVKLDFSLPLAFSDGLFWLLATNSLE
jgi:hypothetical protein